MQNQLVCLPECFTNALQISIVECGVSIDLCVSWFEIKTQSSSIFLYYHPTFDISLFQSQRLEFQHMTLSGCSQIPRITRQCCTVKHSVYQTHIPFSLNFRHFRLSEVKSDQLELPKHLCLYIHINNTLGRRMGFGIHINNTQIIAIPDLRAMNGFSWRERGRRRKSFLINNLPGSSETLIFTPK